MAHETNGFNQWQSAQTLVKQVLQDGKDSYTCLDAMKNAVVKLADTDGMLVAKLLELPSEEELAIAYNHDYDPTEIHNIRKTLKTELAIL